MHHERIPIELFRRANDTLRELEEETKKTIPSETVDFLNEFWGGSKWDFLRFHNLLQELSSFSFVNRDCVAQTLSLHPLVQEWSQDVRQDHRHTSRGLLLLAIPIGDTLLDYRFRALIFPHLRMSEVDQLRLFSDAFVMITGQVYIEGGAFEEGRKLQNEVLKRQKQEYGTEDLRTSITMTNLASSLWYLGRFQEALQMGEQVLELRRRVLGDEHPLTLLSTGNLAWTYYELERYHEAMELMAPVVGLSQRILGTEHPTTIKYCKNFEVIAARI
jgi:tetratricopeptide (TPR) repeat protein